MKKHPNAQRGIIALMTVIMIGLMVITVGITAAFIGQTEIIASGQVDERNRALILAASCLDEGAFRLKLDASYTGGTIAVGPDTCTLGVAGSGTTRTLTATATSGIFSRSIVTTTNLEQNAAANARAWSFGPWVESDAP